MRIQLVDQGRTTTDREYAAQETHTPVVLALVIAFFAAVLFILAPSAEAAAWRTLCHYTEFDHPNTNYGLKVTVEQKYGKVTGNFLVGFYADKHVFASDWIPTHYLPFYNAYLGARTYPYGTNTRYQADLLLFNGFALATLTVQREYLINFMGNPFWIKLNHEGPVIAKWVQLHLRGCNYY